MEPGGRAGHVPTAIHLPLQGLYDAQRALRPPKELRRIFAAADLDGDAGAELEVLPRDDRQHPRQVLAELSHEVA